MIQVQSLFTDLDGPGAVETFTPILEKTGLRIERIDSHGQASPEGFWYDQSQDEWVLLLRGEAILEIADQPPLNLKSGDHLLVRAHIRHRVASTSADALWLAVHLSSDKIPGPVLKASNVDISI